MTPRWKHVVLAAFASAALEVPVHGTQLKARWTFDEGYGSKAANTVAEGPAATMQAQWAEGDFGTALFCSGKPGRSVIVPDHPSLRFGTSSFTLSAWICPTQLDIDVKGGYRRLLCKSNFPQAFWTLDIFKDGRVMFAMRDEDGHTGTTVSREVIREHAWTFLTIVVDREQFVTRFFFNGKLADERSIPKAFTGELDVTGKPLLISTWRPFIGLVDDLTLSTGAATEARVQALYENRKAAYASAAFTAKAHVPPRFAVPIPTGDRQTMWDTESLYQPPATYPAPEFADQGTDGLKALFYEGVPLHGKPTRVFAWIGIPKDAPKPVPGIVLVHGGGGTAFARWVKLWVARGYAAISMDTCGCVPIPREGGGWTRHEYGGPAGWGGFGSVDEAPRDQWTYHAVAAAVRAHSLLREQPGVDKDRIGVTGISWGGYLTSILAGVDQRLRCAISVYGCGFLGENSTWLPSFAALGRERAEKWLMNWDPSRYLRFAKLPMCWVSGTNDFAYPMDSLRKSYRQPRGPRTLCIRVRMPHGHGAAGENPEEIHAFANTYLRDAVPQPRLLEQGRDGRRVWARFHTRLRIIRAELVFTKATGAWQERFWQTLPAKWEPQTGRVTARLPDGITVYYLNIFDDRNCVTSTEHEELKPESQ